MALMNRRLRPGVETIFLMSNETYSFISSRLVKEVFGLGRQYQRAGAGLRRSTAGGAGWLNFKLKGHSFRIMQAVANPIAERISTISVSSTTKVSAEAEVLR